jgi:hypothetical protein
MPVDGAWRTVVTFLAERTSNAEGVERRMREGEVRLGDGTQVSDRTAYLPGQPVYP